MMEEDTARKVRPILRWVKEGASRKREREDATSLLRKIEGIKEHRQVSMTKGEAELLMFIYQEWPDVTFKPRQLNLGLVEERVIDSLPGKRSAKTPKSKLERIGGVESRAAPIGKATLRTSFTKKEQEERKRIGLSPVPMSRPTDARGNLLTQNISDIRKHMEETERSFGKQKEEVTETPDDK